MQCPCKGCTDRWFDGRTTCHSTCTKYAEWSKSITDTREKVHKARRVENGLDESMVKRRIKQMKKRK